MPSPEASVTLARRYSCALVVRHSNSASLNDETGRNGFTPQAKQISDLKKQRIIADREARIIRTLSLGKAHQLGEFAEKGVELRSIGAEAARGADDPDAQGSLNPVF